MKDIQAANEYVFYEIFGSYFKKATLKTKITEKKLYLNFQEFSNKLQYKMEEDIERKILRIFPKYFDLDALSEKEVEFNYRKQESGIYHIYFNVDNKLYKVYLYTDENPTNYKIKLEEIK